jgi:PAS domain S-box-containing protein
MRSPIRRLAPGVLTVVALATGLAACDDPEHRLIAAGGTLVGAVFGWLLIKLVAARAADAAAATLRETQQNLLLAIRSGNVGLWDWDLRTNRAHFSPEWKSQLGHADADIGDDFSEWECRLHPDDRANAVAVARRALEAPYPAYRSEFRLRHKDGSYVWVLAQGTLQRDEQGVPVRLLGSHTDVTERKRAEVALRENEENLRMILDTLNEGVALNEGLFDAHGDMVDYRIIHVNAAFYRHAAFQGQSVIGATATSLYGMPPAMITEFWRQHRAKTETAYTEMPSPLGDRYFVVSTSPFVGNRFVTSFFDITARKHAEAERERMQTQLIQAQKMESVGRLAGGVAHDFNNMLGVIIGHTDLALLKLAPASPVRAELDEIRAAAKHSADLTRQLLAFARKQNVAPRVLDVNATITGMLTMLRRLIGEDIELCWSPGEGLWPVEIDPSQLDQVVTNLCVNARDSISSSGGRITLETRNGALRAGFAAAAAADLRGDYVVLSVSDNGAGMDAETQAHLFEPFFTTKPMGKGTGLGLATVYGVVQQNRGFIDVTSTPGSGSVFTLYLPRHAGAAAPSPAPASEPAKRAAGQTILLVEDDLSVLRLTKAMLEALGYQVLATHSPSAALGLAEQHGGRLELLVTDVVMPEMNGRDLAAKLGALCPRLRTLYMSGYSAEVFAASKDAGEEVPFLPKPFTLDELRAKLGEILTR